MRRILSAGAAALAATALTACGGGSGAAPASGTTTSTGPTSAPTESPAGTAGSSATATASTSGAGAHERSDAVTGYRVPAPIASAKGTIPVFDEQDPHVTIEVLSLRATSSSTVMQLRIKPQGTISNFRPGAWEEDGSCLDRIKLVDLPRRKVYSVGISAVSERQGVYHECLADQSPGSASPEKPLYTFAYYGPVPAGTSRLTLRMKGFPDTEVPVTWAA